MEQRKETRIDYNIRFFVHVHESKDEPEMVGLSLECEAIDFSAHGVQFSTNSVLTAGTLVNVTIGIGEPFAMYMLRGEVRWVRPKDEAVYMGILLTPAENTDLDRWLANFDELFPGNN
ncbi:MAG: PilZ domain-containing protein [Pseudomonadales bacterium]|nr:PilZ domain-containing protein [Pseudomonadales bacterium]MBO6595253.1 PilZ domain-containing protein [Pseudomonadales bacterium]MBO6821188.1 PilZ domain-containing protein [Pseudomonadales bacterium]